MKVEMVMPQMGESIAEGTIIRWTKKEGEVVSKDENILEISTDKVDSEIPSPAAGRIVELKAKEGETVPVGQVIAVLETEAAASPQPSSQQQQPPEQQPSEQQPSEQQPSGQQPTAAGQAPSQTAYSTPEAPAASPPGGGTASPPPPSPEAPPAAPPQAAKPPEVPAEPAAARQAGDRFYSPLVRSIARQEGIPLEELEGVPGSGRGGRVTRDDVLDYIKKRVPGGAPAGRPSGDRAEVPGGDRTGAAARPSPPSGAAEIAAAVPGVSYVPSGPARPETPGRDFEPYPKYTVAETRTTPEGMVEVVQMDTMRQKIAEHMVRSKATSPHVASVTEVDMTQVVRFRERYKNEFQAKHGFKLTYTPFMVAAAVRALVDYPMVNASIEGTQILLKRYVNMGVAVALESGLIVPVVKHAEEKNFLGLSRAIQDLASRARSKKLMPDDVQGGTFALTNMGGFGNLFGIPIINQPNVGILGAGAIVKRPVVLDDAIAIRDIMYLSLSYDHRVVDGALGGRFIQRVRYYLEQVDLVGAF